MMTVDHAWNSLVTMTFQSIALCLMTGAGLLLLRKSAAATRHLLLVLSMSALLAVPFLALCLPHWQVPLYTRASAASRPAVEGATIPARDPMLPTGSGARLLPPEESAPVTSAPAEPPWHARSSRLVSVPTVPLPSPAVSAMSAVGVRSTHVLGWWQTARYDRIILAVWLLGVTVALLRVLAGLIGTLRVTARETTSDPVLSLTVAQIQRELGLECAVTVRRMSAASGLPVPLTWGLVRPTLLLPGTFLEWPQERRRMVVLHELAHIQRADWLVQVLGQITSALYWFHPLVWWTTHRLHAESERACDDAVLLTGVAPLAYAETLLEVIRTMNRSKISAPSLTSMLSMAHPPIEARLQAILSPQRRQRPSRSITFLASLGTAACAIALASVQVRAGQAPSPSQPLSGSVNGSTTPANAGLLEAAQANSRAVTGQPGAGKATVKFQKGRSPDETAVLRQKLDTLELLLVRSQQENTELRQRLKALEAQNRSAADVNRALGFEAQRERALAAQAAEAYRRTEVSTTAQPVSPAAQLDTLQAVMDDLKRQYTQLKTLMQQSEESYRAGGLSYQNATRVKADLDVCIIQMDAVQKQIDDLKAGRKISAKEQNLNQLRVQRAEVQARLRREQESLSIINARYQAGAAGSNDLSKAREDVVDLERQLARIEAQLNQIEAQPTTRGGF